MVVSFSGWSVAVRAQIDSFKKIVLALVDWAVFCLPLVPLLDRGAVDAESDDCDSDDDMSVCNETVDGELVDDSTFILAVCFAGSVTGRGLSYDTTLFFNSIFAFALTGVVVAGSTLVILLQVSVSISWDRVVLGSAIAVNKTLTLFL